MKPFYLFVLSVFFLWGNAANAAEKTHWGYTGHGAPAHWGDLSENYALCKTGKHQSPVNLSGTVKANLDAITFSYRPSPLQVVNNGHTIQVNYQKGSFITVDGRDFALLQFHFHSPSENRINGNAFPMEAHFVHADKEGNLAVVAVMLTSGKVHATLDDVWKHMPASAGGKASPAGAEINAMDLLPDDKRYYRFSGSLTTPPCTEGVRWFVMKAPAMVSGKQADQFRSTMGQHTNRPVQPVNARVVLE